MNNDVLNGEQDYKLTIGMFLLSVVAIVPFFLYHLTQAAWPLASAIGLLIGLLLAGTYRVWRNRDTHHVNLALAVAGTLTLWWTVHDHGAVMIYWAYPLILLHFFLLPVRTAACTIGIGIPIIFLLAASHFEAAHLTRIIASLTLVSFFTYVFSRNVTRQRAKLAALATLDPLTQIGNRRLLNTALEDAAQRFKRLELPTSLIVIDLDHFKAINDSEGHVIGDDVLVAVVERLRQRVRRTDGLYRYGGEEFILLAANSDLATTRELAEELRIAVSATPIACIDRTVTISAGVAELSAGEAWKPWLQRADQALYMAKGNGRNAVVALDADALATPADMHPDAAEKPAKAQRA